MQFSIDKPNRIITGKVEEKLECTTWKLTMSLNFKDGEIRFSGQSDFEEKWTTITGTGWSVLGMRDIAEAASKCLDGNCIEYFEHAVSLAKSEGLTSEGLTSEE